MEKINLPFIGDQKDLAGKYVLVRTSLNVPVKDGQVVNQFRLMRGLPTINYLVNEGAKVILMGHISNHKETEKEETLEPVFNILKQNFATYFSSEVATAATKNLRDKMKNGEVLLLENLRQDPREKKNDADFARALADLADVYVNDAFAASHREHASLVGVPQFLPSFVGHNFRHEYEELSKMMTPADPSLFILGGAKFDTKMPLVEKFLDIYDHVFVGGALANDLFKAAGKEVGQSLVSDVDLETLKPLLANEKILLPTDVTVKSGDETKIVSSENVETNDYIYDAGPETVEMLKGYLSEAKTILWNGPLGNYQQGFDQATTDLAMAIGASDGYSVVGGGDTIASIEALNCQEQYGFLSTAGGAMLHFLEHASLPALDAVLNAKHE